MGVFSKREAFLLSPAYAQLQFFGDKEGCFLSRFIKSGLQFCIDKYNAKYVRNISHATYY